MRIYKIEYFREIWAFFQVKASSPYCPAIEMSLGKYPVTWTGDVSAKKAGVCVAGASAPYDPQAYCNPSGFWEMDDRLSKFCECIAGREPNHNSSSCLR